MAKGKSPITHRRPVYSFYEPLPGSNPEHAYKLMLLWKESWSRQGYEPIVLNESHARQHDLFAFLDRKVSQLPTINIFAYEKACFLRWIAVASVGGGIMTDWDTLIYAPVPELHEAMNSKYPTVTSFQTHIPCCVAGSKAAFTLAVQQMIEYTVTEKDVEEGQNVPHVSDMYMLYRGGVKFTSKDLVKSYGDAGWEQAPLVHWSNSSMKGKQPRHEWITKLRAI